MNNKKKWYIAGAIVIVLLLVLFAGRVKKNGGLTAPKEIAFGKTSGERVWFTTEGGKGKDATVDAIDVTKGNKMIEYQIFDDDITLGKVSKMSNSDVIKLAKKQDRKYFDESIDEVKALRDGKSQIGLQDDMMDDKDLKANLKYGPYFYFLMSDDGTSQNQWKNVRWITKSQYYNNTRDMMRNKYTESQIPQNLIQSESQDGYDQVDDLVDTMRTRRLNALIDNMKSVKYLAPKWQTIRIKNYTDDTGNKVQAQKIKYKVIDEFNDSGTIDENAQKLSDGKKQQISDIVGGQQRNTEGQIKACEKAFDSSYYHQITKNIFKPHTVTSDFTIFEPTSQTIYDSRFIGYALGNDWYQLTKAQNDSQKAVLSK